MVHDGRAMEIFTARKMCSEPNGTGKKTTEFGYNSFLGTKQMQS